MVDVVVDVVEQDGELVGGDIMAVDVVMDLLFVTKSNKGTKGSTRDKGNRSNSSVRRVISLGNQSYKAACITGEGRREANIVGLAKVVEVDLHVAEGAMNFLKSKLKRCFKDTL